MRGTTLRQLVSMLREAGAAEVHFRVSSPPYKWPCFYGLDTGRRSELLAADLSVGEIRDFLGVDSLAYLDLDRLTTATGAPPGSFCTACLVGRVPDPDPAAPHPETDSKLVLEPDAAPLPCPRRARFERATSSGRNDATAAHLRRRGRRHRGGRACGRADQGARAVDAAARGVGDIGGFGGLFAFEPRRPA